MAPIDHDAPTPGDHETATGPVPAADDSPDWHTHGKRGHAHAHATHPHTPMFRAICNRAECAGFGTHDIHAAPEPDLPAARRRRVPGSPTNLDRFVGMARVEARWAPLPDTPDVTITPYETVDEAVRAGRSLSCTAGAHTIRVYDTDDNIVGEWSRHDSIWHAGPGRSPSTTATTAARRGKADPVGRARPDNIRGTPDNVASSDGHVEYSYRIDCAANGCDPVHANDGELVGSIRATLEDVPRRVNSHAVTPVERVVGAWKPVNHPDT